MSLPQFSNLAKEATNRFKTPILSGFIFSWMAWNWKFWFYMIFGKEDVQTKFEIAQQKYLYPYHGLVYPLLTSAILIVAVPFLSTGLEWLVSFAEIRRNERRSFVQAEKERIDLDLLKKELEACRKSLDENLKTIGKLNAQVERYEAFRKQVEITTIAYKHSPGTPKLDSQTEEIAGRIGKNFVKFIHLYSEAVGNNPDAREELRKFISSHNAFISELQQRKFVTTTGSLGFDRREPWEWTIDGRFWTAIMKYGSEEAKKAIQP